MGSLDEFALDGNAIGGLLMEIFGTRDDHGHGHLR